MILEEEYLVAELALKVSLCVGHMGFMVSFIVLVQFQRGSHRAPAYIACLTSAHRLRKVGGEVFVQLLSGIKSLLAQQTGKLHFSQRRFHYLFISHATCLFLC